MVYNPYAGDNLKPPPDGFTLEEYAAAWIDMVPHIGHLTALAAKADLIVEWGLRGCVSTWAMLDGLAEDGSLIGVDIVPDLRWYHEKHGDDYVPGYFTPIPPRVRNDPRFTFIHGDSLEVGLPDHADLVMIDSSHEYVQTVNELARAATLTPAVIACHDYMYSETPAVKQAIDEFVADGPFRLEVVHPSKWGLAILVPK